MNRKDLDLDQALDQAIARIREEAMSPEDERAAAERVWKAVSLEEAAHAEESLEDRQIRDCEDVQALIPAYLQGALNDAKTLLFKDHVSECLPCRKALKQAKSARRTRTVAEPKSSGSSFWNAPAMRWAAAAAVIFLAVIGLNYDGDLLKIKTGGLITIEAIDGELFHVTGQESQPVTTGQQISLERGDQLRTGKGSRAIIQLVDDSLVEMKERTDLGVIEQHAFWSPSDKDELLKLGRGSVIIEAAERGTGHLFVDTSDSRTAVTGTVFAVNHGIKGTRVSVLEGEVEVRYTGNESKLAPGQQLTTRPGLSRVPLEDEIAWSQKLEQHLSLIEEITQLGRELDTVVSPDRRYSTRLLDMAPPDTVVFIGIPNVSSSLADAHEILSQKIQTSPALRSWWEENMVASGADEELALAILKIRDFGEHLGDEVAVTLQMDAAGNVGEPLLLAELVSPDGFRALLQEELAQAKASDPSAVKGIRVFEGTTVPVLTDLGSRNGARDDLDLWIRDDLLVADFRSSGVERGAAALGTSSHSGFQTQLADRYRDGVEWIVGIDMKRIMGEAAEDGREIEVLTGLGLLDMDKLIAERRELDGRTENRVVLTFDHERRGLLAWLDDPAPVGSLDFISPNATLAAAFVMKDPATLVDELFGTLAGSDGNFQQELDAFQAEHGIDIRNDVAATLGGEFAFALDGPIAPTPAWKLIVEVYDPARLQRTLTWAVDQINLAAEEHNDEFQGLRMETSETKGLVFHSIESLDAGLSVHYTFVDGYLLAGPSRAMLLKALETRKSGISLRGAPGFMELLPRDGEIHFSAVVYQNLGSLLGPLTKLGAAASLTPDQQRMVDELAAHSRPSLTVAYGGKDRITFVYTHEGGFISSGLASFFSLQGLMNVQELLGRSHGHGDYGFRVDPDAAATGPYVARNAIE